MALSSKNTMELGSAYVDLNTQLFNIKYLVVHLSAGGG